MGLAVPRGRAQGMTELGLIGELVKGGTTAGLLIAVGWFFFGKFFAMFERMRADAEYAHKDFVAQLDRERASHKEITDFIGRELARTSEALHGLTREQTELRRDLRRDFSDEPGEGSNPRLSTERGRGPGSRGGI